MTPKETHAKQFEFIRVRETGKVYRRRTIDFAGTISVAKNNEFVHFLSNEYDFCTPIGFKDGTAEVVDDPTDYDGEMICIGDRVTNLDTNKTADVYGFFCNPDGEIWLLDGHSDSVMPYEITNHRLEHTKPSTMTATEAGQEQKLLGMDTALGDDYTVKIYGYYQEDGTVQITKVVNEIQDSRDNQN